MASLIHIDDDLCDKISEQMTNLNCTNNEQRQLLLTQKLAKEASKKRSKETGQGDPKDKDYNPDDDFSLSSEDTNLSQQVNEFVEDNNEDGSLEDVEDDEAQSPLSQETNSSQNSNKFFARGKRRSYTVDKKIHAIKMVEKGISKH